MGCFLLPRINLWALKGPIGAETAFQRKMNYKAGSLQGQIWLQAVNGSNIVYFHFVWHSESRKALLYLSPLHSRNVESEKDDCVSFAIILQRHNVNIVNKNQF